MGFLRFGGCALAVALLGVVACSDDKPTIVVSVVSGIVPTAQFAVVETALYAGNPGTDTGAVRRDEARVMASRDQDYAHGHQVASFEGVDPGAYTIEVQMMRADRRLVLRRRVVVQVAGSTALRVHMTPNCIGVACPSPGGAAGYSECIDGQCVDPRCNPPSTEFCEGLTTCATEADCGPYADCAEAVCLDGVCDAAPKPDMCLEPLFCNPLSSVSPGCEPTPFVDGGVPFDASSDAGAVDGGENDASVDGSTTHELRCGSLCVDEENACLFGTVDCSGVAPACNATSVRVGAACDVNRVCDAMGSCTSCVEDAPCTHGCFAGHLRCGSGTPTCVENSPLESASVGTICDAACAGGSTCPGMHVCDRDSECVTCDDGAPCDAGCDVGRIDCTLGGECVSTGRHLPALTTCGTSQVCDGMGACVACFDGEACGTSTGCASGTLTGCGLASPACQYNHFATPGDACEDGTTGVCSGDGRCYVPLRALDVSSNGAVGCVILEDHTVSCWGVDSIDFTSTIVHGRYALPGFSDTVQLVLGGTVICARNSVGAIDCLGSNNWGQVGDGTFESRSTATRVTLPAPAVDLAAGDFSACAALTTGDVYCWGELNREIPGSPLLSPAPTRVTGISGAVQLAIASNVHSSTVCARQSNGHVMCWGSDWAGLLGDGIPFSANPDATHYRATPSEVVGIDDAVDLSLGYSYSACVLRGNHEVWCWGSSDSYTSPVLGALGSSTTGYSPVPVLADLVEGDDITDLESYGYARCFRRSTGVVECMATTNGAGLGRSAWDTALPREPRPVAGVADVARLGTGSSSCLVRSGGEVLCWGFSTAVSIGLGYGTSIGATWAPTNVFDEVP